VLAAVVVIFAVFAGMARASKRAGNPLAKREVLLVEPEKAGS
jgi:hypothetical protein